MSQLFCLLPAHYPVRKYGRQSSGHLIEPFMGESESVVDLRSSPLLLSLLCVLYRARGSLPRRRLEVYSKCADLLFHTWDSHRQIEQPEELPNYGNRLMQEIAQLVFDSSAAQEGLPESVLEKIISVHLADVGISSDEAGRRAKDFLEFCAGRAWLLGSFGTTKIGERLFGFTHRTFFEYFTAEALVRRSKDADDVCTYITGAFERDETSVLPELLIQAYDEKQQRGAPEVFKALCLSGKASAGLLLRLMNGSLLPRQIRRLGFVNILDGWKAERRSVGREAFDALFTLEPNAFEQFVNEFVEQRSEPEARGLVTHGWASNYLLHREHLATEIVVATVSRITQQMVKEGGEPEDIAAWNWLMASGALPLPKRDTWRFLVVGTSAGPVPGALPAMLTRCLLGRRDVPEEAVVQVLGGWVQSLQADGSVPNRLASRMFETADPVVHSAIDPDAISGLGTLEPGDRAVVLATIAIAMIGSELGYPSDVPWFHDVVAVRSGKLGTTRKVSADLGAKVAALCKPLPRWMRLWVLGQHSLVGKGYSGPRWEVMSRLLDGSY